MNSLVTLYNEKFAVPSKGIIDEMTKQGLLNPKSPFGDPLQWTFYELWHHEGRRARHGASMMGRLHPLARHVRGGEALLHEVPAEVLEVAERGGKGEEWKKKVDALMAQDQHVWQKGMTPEEARALQKAYEQRYDEKAAPSK